MIINRYTYFSFYFSLDMPTMSIIKVLVDAAVNPDRGILI
jgi:hypothetical protein